MRLNSKISSRAVAVLAAISLGLLTNQTVHAQSITLHSSYDKTILPYIRQKGKFINANKSIKIKNYKFYGKPILTKGDKVIYVNATTPYIINQDNYYYLGDGGYIKQDNAYVRDNTYVLTRNSYIYEKNGKRLKTFRGKRAYLTANTKIKSGVRDEYYRKPYTYYNIGKNIYIQSD
ncbi:SLAP domain-containing protein [uncultured Lactobacillus sp.]|uniref:SLAP domain-containing protein n=1 Tax=uncultured Lactobacillus sp. TaxID=153152 RepID=UPI002614E001|nr:SLAP domain-containing protein [uncultured Lactobacillus sp.]